MSGTVEKVTDESFANFIKSKPLVIADCWAAWCGPCQMIAPIIEELSREHSEKIVFGKLNVDENREVPVKYQVMSIPTLLFFKNGQHVDTILGAVPKSVIEQKINQL